MTIRNLSICSLNYAIAKKQQIEHKIAYKTKGLFQEQKEGGIVKGKVHKILLRSREKTCQ